MGQKRRYQSSSTRIGIPPPPLPPPEYFANLTYSYNSPITPAQIAVNPCLTSKKIPAAATSSSSNHHPQQQSSNAPSNNNKITSKGNRTYRVKHHHQNHYELPVAHQQTTNNTTGTAPGGDQTRRPSSSLSQGIFGLPVMQDFFLRQDDCITGETLDEQRPPLSPRHPINTNHPKPRMKSTLPSFKNILHQESSPNNHHEDMDGILHVRPASRSRTRPELSGGGGTMRRSTGGGARRRVQSSIGFHKPPGSAETIPDPHSSPTCHVTTDTVDTILAKLKSQDTDWEDIVEAFHSIQRITLEHSPQINKLFLRKIVWAGLAHLSSPRTKLVRAACQCFKSLYETQRNSMEGEGDKVFHRLLDLCGGPSNKFIQEECKIALLAAIHNTDPLKCLCLLEQFGVRHKNQNVKEVAALLLGKIMEVVTVERLMSKEFAPRVLPMVVSFLKEGQLNTRLNGKQCLAKLFHHPEFHIRLKRYVTPENIRLVQDTIKKFQNQQRGTQSRIRCNTTAKWT